jgi:hypothetical protein
MAIPLDFPTVQDEYHLVASLARRVLSASLLRILVQGLVGSQLPFHVIDVG